MKLLPLIVENYSILNFKHIQVSFIMQHNITMYYFIIAVRIIKNLDFLIK